MRRTLAEFSAFGKLNIRLIERRLTRGWSPNDLARQAGVTGNTVRAAERGDYVCPRTQKAIADALEADLLELFPFERQRLTA